MNKANIKTNLMWVVVMTSQFLIRRRRKEYTMMNKQKILVADNGSKVCEFIRIIMKSGGYVVKTDNILCLEPEFSKIFPKIK